jgi:hypothetical protein
MEGHQEGLDFEGEKVSRTANIVQTEKGIITILVTQWFGLRAVHPLHLDQLDENFLSYEIL